MTSSIKSMQLLHEITALSWDMLYIKCVVKQNFPYKQKEMPCKCFKQCTGNIPMLLVTPTHLPWNQSSHKSQHIIKRLLCGFLQMHHSLSGSSSEFQLSSELSASESSSSSSSAFLVSISDNRLLYFMSVKQKTSWLLDDNDKNVMQNQRAF